MSNLPSKIATWKEHGLLSSDQADRILEFERIQTAIPASDSAQKNSQKDGLNWATLSFFVLGFIVLGTGVIGVVAANWHLIPDWFKLGVDFAILAIVARVAIKFYDHEKNFVFEGLLTFFLILCLASIGLISQIYHTGGELYQAFFFWSIATAPVAFYCRTWFPAFLWVAGFVCSGLITLYENPFFHDIYAKQIHLYFAVIPLATGIISMQLNKIQKNGPLTRSFRFFMVMSWINAIVWLGFIKEGRGEFAFLAPAFLIFLGFCILTIIQIHLNRDYSTVQRKFLYFIVGGFIGLFLIMSSFSLPGVFFDGAAIILYGLSAIFCAASGWKKTFHFFVWMIGITFFMIYLKAFGGLAATGFGLIFSGLLILTTVWYWHQHRERLSRWVEGFVHE